MNPEVQQILEITGGVWLVAIIYLSLSGIVRLARNGLMGVPQPRREVIGWITDWASKFTTGAALIALTVYFFTEWLDTYGLILSLVFLVMILLAVIFMPVVARWSQARK